MTAGRICCLCQQPIQGECRTFPRESMSGGRPPDYAHLQGDEACRPQHRPGPGRAPGRRRP